MENTKKRVKLKASFELEVPSEVFSYIAKNIRKAQNTGTIEDLIIEANKLYEKAPIVDCVLVDTELYNDIVITYWRLYEESTLEFQVYSSEKYPTMILKVVGKYD